MPLHIVTMILSRLKNLSVTSSYMNAVTTTQQWNARTLLLEYAIWLEKCDMKAVLGSHDFGVSTRVVFSGPKNFWNLSVL